MNWWGYRKLAVGRKGKEGEELVAYEVTSTLISRVACWKSRSCLESAAQITCPRNCEDLNVLQRRLDMRRLPQTTDIRWRGVAKSNVVP